MTGRRPGLFTLVPACVLALAAATSACSTPTSADERVARARRNSGEIVVGAAWAWTARKNILFGEGMNLAVDEINRRGGVGGRPLRVLREDDAETVDQGRLVAQRFASNPDVVAVIGHLHSYVSTPAAAIYDLSGLLMIAPTSTNPGLTRQGYRRVFRPIFTDRDVGRQMADLAAARGYKRLAIYYVRSDYGRDLANAFEERATERGVTIVDRQSYDPNVEVSARHVGDILDEWKLRDPQGIFIAGEAGPAARITSEARQRGITAPILGGDALGTPELFRLGAEAVEGTVIATPFHPDEPRPEARAFVQAFEQRYGMRPDAGAALAYDAVQLLAHAMSAAGSTVPERVADAMHAVSDWRGVTGTFTFTPEGDVVERPIASIVARGGRFEYAGPRTAAQPVGPPKR